MLVHYFHALGHACKFVLRCKNLYRIGPKCKGVEKGCRMDVDRLEKCSMVNVNQEKCCGVDVIC